MELCVEKPHMDSELPVENESDEEIVREIEREMLLLAPKSPRKRRILGKNLLDVFPESVLVCILSFLKLNSRLREVSKGFGKVFEKAARAKYAKLFHELVGISLGTCIEENIFSVCNNTVSKKYFSKGRTTILRLKNKSQDIRNRVLNKELSVSVLVKGNPRALLNQKQLKVQQKFEEDYMNSRRVKNGKSNGERLGLKCPNCKSCKVHYYQWTSMGGKRSKIRLLCVCLECGHGPWDL